jgi:hypothetical protein
MYAAAGADFATLVPNPSKIEGLSTLANTVSKDSTVAKEVA